MEWVKVIGISILAYVMGLLLGFLIVRKVIHNIIFWVFSLLVGKSYTSGYDLKLHSTYDWLEINPYFIITNWILRIFAELSIAYFVFRLFNYDLPIIYCVMFIGFYVINSFSEYRKYRQDKNSISDISPLDLRFPLWFIFCVLGGVIIGSIISIVIIY